MVFTRAVSPRIWNVMEARPAFAWREGISVSSGRRQQRAIGRATAAGNQEHHGSLAGFSRSRTPLVVDPYRVTKVSGRKRKRGKNGEERHLMETRLGSIRS